MHFIICTVLLCTIFGIGGKAQGDMPQCVVSCMSSASNAAGCSGSADWGCMCAQPSFRSAADRCFVQTCADDQAQIGENMIDTQCSGQTSTSIPPPFSPPATSLSVTNSETSPQQSSGPPRPTSISQAPPTPPPTTTPGSTPAQTSTAPGTITQTPSTSVTGTGTATNTSIGTATGNATTEASNATTSGSTVPSGTIQQPPSTSSASNSAFGLDLQSEKLFGAILGLFGAWIIL